MSVERDDLFDCVQVIIDDIPWTLIIPHLPNRTSVKAYYRDRMKVEEEAVPEEIKVLLRVELDGLLRGLAELGP